MKKVNIAIIGCGTISKTHLPVLKRNDRINIKYVIDVVEQRAVDAKNQFGAEFSGTDYKVALNDNSVDAVFVLTPNYLHYTITMDALNAGKHVFCEKPITVNYALSKEMYELAEKKNLILNIGVVNRYKTSVNIIKKMYEEGKLGEVYHVYCSFRSFRSIPGLGGPFTTKEMAGGGVLIDWGVHFLDLIMYVLDAKATTVSAKGYNKLAKNMEDYLFHGNMWAGPPKYDGVNDVEEMISGFVRTDKASISFNGAWAQNINVPEMFIDFMGDKAGVRMMYNGTFTIYKTEDRMFETITPDFETADMFYDEDDAFVDSILSGKKTRSNIEYVLPSAKLLDAIYQSSEEDKEINL